MVDNGQLVTCAKFMNRGLHFYSHSVRKSPHPAFFISVFKINTGPFFTFLFACLDINQVDGLGEHFVSQIHTPERCLELW